MSQQWQRDLPIAKESVVTHKRQNKEVFRSKPFPVKSGNLYEILITASWSDDCKNGSNVFYVRTMAVPEGSSRESEVVSPEDAPAYILASIPAELSDLRKWNGCHSFGPWYYIENTVYLAGERDCNGLLAGQRKQIINGKSGEPCWHLVGIGSDGEEIPTYRLNLTHDGARPTSQYRLEWREWCRVGEGKARELSAARNVAIWPDATDKELSSPTLSADLAMRLPSLLVEFRKVVEGLGFTW